MNDQDYYKEIDNKDLNNNYYSQGDNIPYNTIYSSFDGGNKQESFIKKYGKFIIPVVIILLLISYVIIAKPFYKEKNKKGRTFMIYMVGSDLESKSSQGTYSIDDIVGENIDLETNNVILMVGGSKLWHNFVSADEIGIYELTKEGFKKIKKLPIENMGASDTLESFLNYSYKNFPAEKYEMIFWNHGLGAIGIEQDEIAKDFLTINELNNAFSNSAFKKEKLELTIFYNCLASNIHIANVMKNYSEYMVASEEIFYLSKVLNRLSFLEQVTKDNDGYEIGKLFIEQSDKVVKDYNVTHSKKIDSTLAILDLSKIDDLTEKVNNYVKNIDINKNYYNISSIRRNSHTYGISQTYDYDTVDLYNLVVSLGKITKNQDEIDEILNEIKSTVMYFSSLNDYSNGISIYFPYFGSTSSIETHLSLFEKVSNNDYYNFINNFYQIRSGARKSRRASNNNEVNKLTNDIVIQDGVISLELTEEEKKNYQDAKIYLFSLNGDKYELLLQSNDIKLEGNNLVFKNNKILKVNDDTISYINDNNNMVYGKIIDNKEEIDVKYTIQNNKIVETILDSDEFISSSLIEHNDYKDLYFSKLTYSLFEDGKMIEDWKTTKEEIPIKIDKNKTNITIDNNDLSDYYIMIEMYDMYNDVYYSNLRNSN